MTNILLTFILIILLLEYLGWTPGNVIGYLKWKRRQLKRWVNKVKAQRRKQT